MKVSLKWLKQYVPGLNASVDAIVDALPMAGLEVESVQRTGLEPNEFLVVGEVLSREQHPNADRLSVCKVRTSPTEEPRQIVCGATNYKVGDRVPVALPGCRLGEDFKIKKGKLRGVESNGMLCSGKEIGLGEDHEGLLILSGSPEVGTPMHELYGEGDTVIELELTANRGDCMSHIGVARELAAIYSLELRLPEVADYSGAAAVAAAESAADKGEDLLERVEVSSPDCPYYTAYRVRGVKVGESPEWLKTALEAVGLRPINTVVDITNYVLHETGQPLHAFDAAKIRGKVLNVRLAREGEKITTLDEKERTLTSAMTVIADAERPLVVAGVMGSVNAEVDENTTDIVLESAWFRPGAVRATSRRLALFTDSSQRFSRDVDPAGVANAAARALDLILKLAGGTVVGMPAVVGNAPRGDRTIELSLSYLVERIGFAVEPAVVEAIFHRLCFAVRSHAEGGDTRWSVTVPSFRPEVDRPIDLVEEFIRLYGTVNVPQTRLTSVGLQREDAPLARFNRAAADFLVARGFYECVHYSLVDGTGLANWEYEGHFPATLLDNPLTSEMSHLRTSLVPGLVEAFRLNQSRGNSPIGLFETGRVFRRTDDTEAGPGKPFELASVAFVLRADEARRHWQHLHERPDFFTAKALCEALVDYAGGAPEALKWTATDHPAYQEGHSAAADCWIADALGVRCGLLDLAKVAQADVDGILIAGEILFDTQKLRLNTAEVVLKPFSDFPPSEKDIAIVVPQHVAAADVTATLAKVARAAVGGEFEVEGEPRLFDLYQGKGLPEGHKSLAFTLRFRSTERTLNEKEVATAFETILSELKAQGYALRTA